MIRSAAISGAAALAVACAASAQPVPPARPIFDAALDIPDAARTLIVVDNAAGFRQSPAGAAATEVVATVADFTRTKEAWTGLSQQLKLTDAETFDTLLGRRVVFAAQPLPDDNLDWVILSTIDRDTEQRLRSALRATPRAIAGGFPVLSVENGRFELVLAPRNDDRILILAPAGSTGLFESVVRHVGKGGPPQHLAATEPLLRARTLGGQPRALAVFRETDAWLSVTFQPVGNSIRASFIAGGEGVKTAEVQPWSLDKFTATSRGALLSLVESDSLPSNLRIASRLGQASLTRIFMPPDPHRLRGGRVVVRASPSATGPIDLAVAMQTSSVDRLAVDGDRNVARFLASFKAAGDTANLPYDFAGAAPAATRVVNLSEVLPPGARLGWKEGPELAWNYRVGGIPEGDNQSGWWTIGLGRPAVDQLSELLSVPDPPHQIAAWLSVGMVRPSDILSTLQARGFPIPPAAGALRWIDQIQWKCIRTPDALIQGDAGVDLTPAQGQNPAP